jgi:hydrogenase 3 maturation protease
MSITIVLGVGNQLGGDDAAGSCVVDMLKQRQRGIDTLLSAGIIPIVIGIDTGTAPESYTSVIRQHRPDLLVLVDAADMGLPPGSLRIIPPERISVLSFSTHSMTLSMFIAYVEEFCGKVLLVGVQPGQTEIGGRISKAVHRSVRKLAEAILGGQVAEIPMLEQTS